MVLALVMQGKHFALSLHYNGDESYLYANKTEICKFKANDNISWYNFSLENASKDFTKDEQRKILLNGVILQLTIAQFKK